MQEMVVEKKGGRQQVLCYRVGDATGWVDLEKGREYEDLQLTRRLSETAC